MAKILWKGGAMLAPIPSVMVTCGDEERSNIITVAWCGMMCTQPPITYISVRKKRYSYGLIRDSGEFAINLTTNELVRSADYCGVYTGAKVDKFEKCALTREKASLISAPLIAESPISLECRVRDVLELGTHDVFIADILAVNVDENLIDKNGALRIERAKLAAFAHGNYFSLGEHIGSFGFAVKKKSKKSKKAKNPIDKR